MPEITAIKMIKNSWDSNGHRLGRGNTYQVPGEVSVEDADLLILAGKCEVDVRIEADD